jgi:hypothetical protein
MALIPVRRSLEHITRATGDKPAAPSSQEDAMRESVQKRATGLREWGLAMKGLMMGGAAALAMAGMASAQEVVAPTPEQQAAPVAQPAATGPAHGPLQIALEPYAVYQQDVTTLRDANINSVSTLGTMVELGASHHYPALAKGVIAYGALAAAQSPTFVRAVRDAEAYFGRQGLILQLTRDSGYARNLRGSGEAGQLAMGAINHDVTRIDRVARRFTEIYRTNSGTRWGRTATTNGAARVQRLAGMGTATNLRPVTASLAARLFAAPASQSPAADATALGGAYFWDAATTSGAVTYQASATPPQYWRADSMRFRAIDSMLSLAALHALGAETDRPEAYEPLLNDQLLSNCMAAAQSGYLACQGSTGREHENAFCLAKHALGWAEGDVTVNSVALCIARLTEPGVAPAVNYTPFATATSAVVTPTQ